MVPSTKGGSGIVDEPLEEQTADTSAEAAKNDPIAAPGHRSATWAVQHRGLNDRSDASVARAGVSSEAISMEELARQVTGDTAGAIITFCGQVRDHDDARSVTSIDYEAHPDADAVVQQIAHDVAQGSGAFKVAVVHRVGHLEVGEIALGAAVSAAHRQAAFGTLERLIEEIKLNLPVWKRQEFSDGSHEWTGSA